MTSDRLESDSPPHRLRRPNRDSTPKVCCSHDSPSVSWISHSELLAHVLDEPLRRVLAPLTPEPCLGPAEMSSPLRVRPAVCRPTLVNTPPRIVPVVLDLSPQQAP